MSVNKDPTSTVTNSGVPLSTLRTFVPLNVLSDSHLYTLSREFSDQFFTAGQTIASIDELQQYHYFLLSGTVRVQDENGVSAASGLNDSASSATVSAGSAECRLALGDGHQQACSAKAVDDCRVIIVDRKVLEAMLCWDQAAKALAVEFGGSRNLDEDADWMNMLLSSNLFHKIPPYNVNQIFDQFEARVVSAGETILRQGEEGDTCYVIKEGRAVVSQVSASLVQRGGSIAAAALKTDDIEQPEIVAELYAGTCFGEDALLNKTTRNATVTMETNGVLMCLKKRDFFALLVEPDIASCSIEEARTTIAKGARWLDVRSEEEYEASHFQDAFHLPMHLMTLKSRMLEPDTCYIAYCSSGKRASTVAYLLSQQGYHVVPLAGEYSQAA